jgi:hypothetical protein
MRRLIFALVLLLLAVPSVQAIGISPPYREIYFEPGLEKNFTFFMIGAPESASVVKPYLEGNMSEFMTVPNRTYFLDEKSSDSFQASMSLPQEYKPGRHKIYVGILEQKTGGGEGIFARVGIQSIIEVRVPYPAKYIEMDLECPNVNIGDTARFIDEITNFGTKDISDITGSVEILSPNDQKVTDLDMEQGSIFLSPQEKKELTARWDTREAIPGIYHAVFSVNYDGKQADAACRFRVGDLKIDILSLEADDVEQGKIARFDASLQSIWNDDIPQVFTELLVFDDEGNLVGSSSGETVRMGVWSSRNMTLYWDTENNDAGDYTARLSLEYEGMNSSRTAEFKIISPFNIPWAYIVVILLVVVIAYQVWQRRKR